MIKTKGQKSEKSQKFSFLGTFNARKRMPSYSEIGTDPSLGLAHLFALSSSNHRVSLESWVEFLSCSLKLLVTNYRVITPADKGQGGELRKGKTLPSWVATTQGYSAAKKC